MRRADWILIVALAFVSCAWCYTASRRIGATFDEPFYLEAGLDYWRHGHFGQLLAAGVMPLASHLQTLPVYIAERSSGRLFTIDRDLGEMLHLARPVTLVFWIVLLVSTMRLGRLWGGNWGGRGAVLLVALEPNFLAHASLATTDIALAACFTAFIAQWLQEQQRPAVRRIGLPALWLGLAITAKISALALFPFAAAIVVISTGHGTWRRILVDAIAILGAGLLFAVVYSGTGGQTWLTTTLSGMATDDWRRPIVAWLGSLPVFPNALYAVWFQLSHNAVGQPVFIAGRAGTAWIWFYLPLLLLIKLTLPMLAAVTLGVAVTHSRLRDVSVGAAMLIAVIAMFRVQTGIRFMFPLLVLLVAWAAAQLAALFSRPNRTWRLAVIAIPLWIAIESAMVWPDGIRYVNELWGGSNAGYRMVSDSNYDWGQGLPELAAWRRERGVEMAVWYFGTDTRFPEIVRYNPRLDRDAITLEGRVLAVSASLLYGGYLETPDPARTLIEELRASTPIARTSTFFVFAARR